MPALSPLPTPIPEANAVLWAFLTGVREILRDRVVGIYLAGSLATGEFDQSSDIDALVVTTGALPAETVAALAAMHERFSAGAAQWGKWGWELEVSYVPKDAVRRYDPANDMHPYIDRGGRLRMERHGREWDIHRHVIREWGIVVEGPSPLSLIDPVGPNDVRQAVLVAISEWWPRFLQKPSELHPRGYRSYMVLTGCRMLYTLEFGTVVSKPAATRWAQETLGPRWSALIAWAVTARHGPYTDELDNLSEALDFIRFVIERGRHFELAEGAAPDE